jgi:hypothetical protein
MCVRLFFCYRRLSPQTLEVLVIITGVRASGVFVLNERDWDRMDVGVFFLCAFAWVCLLGFLVYPSPFIS